MNNKTSKTVNLRLHTQKDADVIAWLDAQNNVSQSLRMLVREKIRSDGCLRDIYNSLGSGVPVSAGSANIAPNVTAPVNTESVSGAVSEVQSAAQGAASSVQIPAASQTPAQPYTPSTTETLDPMSFL